MYLTGIYITPIFAAVNQSIKCRLAYIFELVYRPTRSKTRRCFSSSVGLPTDSVDSLISRHFNLDFTDVTVHCARRVFLGHRKLLLWKTRPWRQSVTATNEDRWLTNSLAINDVTWPRATRLTVWFCSTRASADVGRLVGYAVTEPAMCLQVGVHKHRTMSRQLRWILDQGWNCRGVDPHSSCLQTPIFEWKLSLNFNLWAKFQTFWHLTPSSFRSIPTLFVIGGDAISRCLRGLLALFLVDILSRSLFLPHPTQRLLFLCKFGRITRPVFLESGEVPYIPPYPYVRNREFVCGIRVGNVKGNWTQHGRLWIN